MNYLCWRLSVECRLHTRQLTGSCWTSPQRPLAQWTCPSTLRRLTCELSPSKPRSTPSTSPSCVACLLAASTATLPSPQLKTSAYKWASTSRYAFANVEWSGPFCHIRQSTVMVLGKLLQRTQSFGLKKTCVISHSTAMTL